MEDTGIWNREEKAACNKDYTDPAYRHSDHRSSGWEPLGKLAPVARPRIKRHRTAGPKSSSRLVLHSKYLVAKKIA